MASSKMISKPGSNKSVRVLAHERKRPVRNAVGPAPTTAQHAYDEDIADNAFGAHLEPKMEGSPISGLAGEPRVNHLKAAVGLLNRKRA